MVPSVALDNRWLKRWRRDGSDKRLITTWYCNFGGFISVVVAVEVSRFKKQRLGWCRYKGATTNVKIRFGEGSDGF